MHASVTDFFKKFIKQLKGLYKSQDPYYMLYTALYLHIDFSK